jgi:hypothetical protein
MYIAFRKMIHFYDVSQNTIGRWTYLYLKSPYENSKIKVEPEISIQFNNKKKYINYWGGVTQPGEFKKDRYASTLIKNKNYEPFAEYLSEDKKSLRETKK